MIIILCGRVDLKIGRLSGWAWSNYLFSQKQQELEKSEAWGEFDTLLSTWSWKGPYAEKLQWPLGADGDPQLTQVRKQGTWSYNSNEMCSANNLNELPDKSPAWVTPWFWRWETLSWAPSQTKPGIWPTEPWTKKLPLLSATTFGVICYGSNRTRMHRTKAMHLERLVAPCNPGPQHHLVPSFLHILHLALWATQISSNTIPCCCWRKEI